MPEDRDFKKLVRARMERTGERYTEARAQLRPEATDAADPSSDPARLARWVVPMDGDSLADVLAETAGPRLEEVPEGPARPPAGPLWQLKVLAGGPLDSLATTSVSLPRVARLGAAVHGIGYLGTGLEMVVPLRVDLSRDAAALQGRIDARRAHADLLAEVEERAGFAVERWSGGFAVDRFATRADETGVERMEALTEAVAVVRPGDESVIDFAPIRERAAVLPGRAWVGYGVVVIVNRVFPEHRIPPKRLRAPVGGGRYSSWVIDVDMAFWTAVGDAVTAAARAAHLPAWPLEEAWMRCLSRAGTARYQYRPRWGFFR